MKKVLILFLLLLCMSNVSAQYHLAYKECAYLAIPDPPYNGYVAHALWNVNNSNLTFEAADEALEQSFIQITILMRHHW